MHTLQAYSVRWYLVRIFLYGIALELGLWGWRKPWKFPAQWALYPSTFVQCTLCLW